MNELKPEDVMRALELKVQRHLMPNVDIDGTVKVEDAERWFLRLLKEELAPYVASILREKDAEIERLTQERDDARRDCAVAEQNHYECKKELEEMSDDILDSVRAERDRYKAESEQYQTEMLKRSEEIERVEKDFWGSQADIKMRLADARAEAITEFAEKLKERMREAYPADIYDSDIDQISNELKGERNEQM